MTKLTKAIARVVPSRYQKRDLVVTLAREGVYIREYGRRKLWGPVAFDTIWTHAVTVESARQRAAKAAKRKGGK